MQGRGAPGALASPEASPARPVPVEGGLSAERVDADVLLHQAVQENREGRKADVVQGQVGGVVQSLRENSIGLRTALRGSPHALTLR